MSITSNDLSFYLLDLDQAGHSDIADAIEFGLLTIDEAERLVVDRQLQRFIAPPETLGDRLWRYLTNTTKAFVWSVIIGLFAQYETYSTVQSNKKQCHQMIMSETNIHGGKEK